VSKTPRLPYERWGKVSPGEVAGIVLDGGPVFMTYGKDTVAVLISHAKWKHMNHRLPTVDPDKALHFYVDGQAYVVIPCEARIGSVLRPKPSTGLEIITRKRSKRNV
jgi:hypothetical protein